MFEFARDPHASVELEEIEHMLRPPHIRHCIDLLRQSIMCQPDLTVEKVDPTISASKGFGVTHVCKDYSQLLSFMTQWEQRDPRLTARG